MKGILRAAALIAAMASSLATFPCQAAEMLTNDSIVQMVKLGLAKDIILAKIKAEPQNFDTSASALADLQHEGVPTEIITAMISGPAPAATAAPSAEATETVSSGIYYGNPPSLSALDGVHATSEISNSRRYIPIAGQFMSSQTIVHIPGKTATIALDTTTKTFYTREDPSHFRLLHLGIDHNGNRYVVFTKGVSDREIPVSSHRLTSGLYELDLSKALEKGEQYGWLVTPNVGNAGGGLAALMLSGGGGNDVMSYDFSTESSGG